MEMATDTYLTIDRAAESQFTEKRSRFISFAYPVKSPDDVKRYVGEIQKRYYDARHVCYAYMLGPQRNEWRANDNGEPSGTAGKPILGQINSNNLTDILIVVVRYFGGVKLGTSGLIEAYRQAASDAIAAAEVVERYVQQDARVLFSYPMMNDVMRVVKDINPEIVSQEYGCFTVEGHDDGRQFDCRMVLRTRLTVMEQLLDRLHKIVETQRVPEIVVTV